MRAAARRQIEVVDLDHSQLTFTGRLLTKRQDGSFFRRHLTNLNRTALPDDLISEIDCPLNSFVCRIVKRDIDLAFVLKHAKAVRRRVEQLYKRSGKNVLTRVLLHVIEPSQPINFAVDLVADLRSGPDDYV